MIYERELDTVWIKRSFCWTCERENYDLNVNKGLRVKVLIPLFILKVNSSKEDHIWKAIESYPVNLLSGFTMKPCLLVNTVCKTLIRTCLLNFSFEIIFGVISLVFSFKINLISYSFISNKCHLVENKKQYKKYPNSNIFK